MTVLNALSEATNNPTIAAIVGGVVGFMLREFGPKLVQAFEQRYIDPKKRHRQVFLEQVDWYEERAQKLNVLAVQLRRELDVDKFRLALLVSRLDRFDTQWAMKYSDVAVLIAAADAKNKECLENAAECARSAEEVTRTMWWD